MAANVQSNRWDWMWPVWSHQHGAYVTLLTSWLIATVLSEHWMPSHIVVLITTVAGLNGIEILQEFLKRKVPLSQRKRVWGAVYGTMGLGGAILLLVTTKSAIVILPILAISSWGFIRISLRRLHKKVLVEWLAFASLVLAGLLAFDPSNRPGLVTVELWMILSGYFGVSIFLVKARLGQVSMTDVIGYLILSTGVILGLSTWRPGVVLLAILITVKLLSVVMAAEWYRRRSIRSIGFMELGYCFILVTLMTLEF